MGRSYGWTFGGTNVSIVDVRTSDAFYQGHIPFALNIPGTVFKSNISNTNKLSDILGSAGVNVSHETVLISGAGLTRDAALTFVLLEKLGQKKVSVFMNSMDGWVKLVFALTKDSTVVGPKKGRNDLSIHLTTYPGNVLRNEIFAELVCYSDDPGEAAVNYFILKLMGYPDIKVFMI